MNSTAGGDTSMLLPVLCQQQGEQTRKAKEAFDSLFDDHYVFGIPHKTGNRSDWCSNETSAAAAAAAAAASSYDGGQYLPNDLFS